jgi:hypothetical protein
MPVIDLWPNFQTPEAINSPVRLLKEQAAQLRPKTKGLVLAVLKSASTPDGNFWVGFDLYSPALGEYRYRLFEVTYPPQFSPITLTDADGDHSVQTLSEFESLLGKVFHSTRTRQVVEAIMAQATALGATEDGK